MQTALEKIPFAGAEERRGPPDGRITELRALLAEKYPPQTGRKSGVFPVILDPAEPGLALQRGIVTEVSGSIGSGSLFLESLLNSAAAARAFIALVDGAGGYDPCGEASRLRHLLWVLCRDAQTAIKAADLLLRDGNLPLVVLDLQMNPARELRRIPAPTWYRFQRILEHSSAAFVVLTSRPMVSSAAERLSLNPGGPGERWTLRAMRLRREELRLKVESSRRARFGEPGGSTVVAMERRIA